MGGRLEKLRVWDTLHPPDFEALRALLLDYQERGRALERIAATPLLNDGGAQRRLGQVVTEARATLKGKSHD